MKLDTTAGDVNFGAGAGLKLTERLVVKGVRISYLGFCRADARIGLDNQEIGVADDQSDDIRCVLSPEGIRSSLHPELLHLQIGLRAVTFFNHSKCTLGVRGGSYNT